MTTYLDADVPLVDEQDFSPFADLRAQLVGDLAEPGESGYDEHVTPWNLAQPMRPAAVVVPSDAHDVAATVRFARQRGMTVGVQATGHGAVSSLAGHILISTKRLDEVAVHPQGRWARVGAGVKWLRVIEAAAPYGLATLNGSTSDVGVVGYTTGGGVGPMARTHGLAADKVRAFDVVTGDGVLRRVTPTENSDLFLALRGGKGIAAIVTAVEFDLVHLPTFYGGAVYFDGADIPAVIDRWRKWSAVLPEQGTTSFVIFQLPPIPGVPPQLAGRMTIGVRFLWTGDHLVGRVLLDAMRDAAPVLLDDAAVKPYTAVDSVHADPVDPMPVEDPAILLSDLPDEAVARLLEHAGPGSGSPQVMVEVRQLGGAYSRPNEHPDAFDHRDARYSLLTVGMVPDPSVIPHAHRLFDALAHWDTGGIWPNFGPLDSPASARRAYSPDTLARLAAVADAYDPNGVLVSGVIARAALESCEAVTTA